MSPSLRGLSSILAALTAVALPLLLAGCMGPMGRQEAESYANRRMARFCAKACGTWHITGAQRMKGRWLVDFDSPRHKLAVLVTDGGDTEVTVWDKTQAPTIR